MTQAKPETVTLSRRAHDALVKRAEDADDRVAVARQEAREEALGKTAARADHLPVEMVKRMIAGESPVRIWREHRDLKLRELAEKVGVTPGYLSEIENGKKPGTIDVLGRVAQALGVKLDDLI